MAKDLTKYSSQKDFTTLEAWKKARTVKLFFYKEAIPQRPPQKKFNLNVQISKAAISGTANISEGYGRYYYQEGIKFYRTSRASIYVNENTFEKGISLIEEAKAINGYINFVNGQKEKEELKEKELKRKQNQNKEELRR